MSYLLGITIGPVQTYIQESRKLSDLNNSSRIISDMMLQIIKLVKQKNISNKIIYPYNLNADEGTDCSNYMVFELKEIIDMKNIENEIYSQFTNELKLLKQFEDSFHLFWNMVEIIDDQYYTAYTRLSQTMNNLKNTYTFDQMIQESNRKCDICGKRVVETDQLNEIERKEKRLKEDENLCKMCLLKRTYGKSSFKSTYSVAIEKWKKTNEIKLSDISQGLDKVFEDDDKYYSENRIEGAIRLLKESQRTKKLKKMKELNHDLNGGIKKENLKRLIIELEGIKDKMKKCYREIGNPEDEYAFIQFDIDQLGLWMSGYFIERREENLREHQEKVSQMLVEFGLKLKTLLKNHCEIIYSGGDDFLGVLPNVNILEALRIIDSVFKEEVTNKIAQDKNILKKMTYSTSVTIVPCRKPMGEVIEKSRRELENIKNRFENDTTPKNGVVFNYIVNDCKEITCYIKRENIQTLLRLIKDFKAIESHLSFSYIEKFENVFSSFNYEEITFEQLRAFCFITEYELKRLMIRSKLRRDEAVLVSSYIDDMVTFIKSMLNQNYIEKERNKVDVDFRNIINIMKINKKLIECASI